MKDWRRPIWLACLLAVSIPGGWFLLRQSEPRYNGVPLDTWLEQGSRAGEMGEFFPSGEINSTNAIAVRAIGKDAVPTLLRLISTRDSAFRQTVMEFSKDQQWMGKTLPVEEVYSKGAYGFVVLGADAKPAVPRLIALLEDKEVQVRSMAIYCLALIGKEADPAVEPLKSLLTHNVGMSGSEVKQTKYLACYALGAIGQAAQPAIPQLKALTHDPAPGVRAAAHAALIKLTGDGLVSFIDALKDTSNTTNCFWALRSAQQLGTNAASAVHETIAILQTGEPMLTENAIIALGAIHSQPQHCIPAILPYLQSTNGFIRMHSLIALRAFGKDASGLIPTDAITQCLSDSEELPRKQATNTLRQLWPQMAAQYGIR